MQSKCILWLAYFANCLSRSTERTSDDRRASQKLRLLFRHTNSCVVGPDAAKQRQSARLSKRQEKPNQTWYRHSDEMSRHHASQQLQLTHLLITKRNEEVRVHSAEKHIQTHLDNVARSEERGPGEVGRQHSRQHCVQIVVHLRQRTAVTLKA